MGPILFLFALLGGECIVTNSLSSFELTLNVDGIDNHFQFFETTSPESKERLPSIVILDEDHDRAILKPSHSSSAQHYQVDSEENLLGFATVIDRTTSDSHLLFAMVQTPDGSLYDISSPMSTKQKGRPKRSSTKNAYVVKFQNSVLDNAYATIEWNDHRQRRAVDEAESKDITMKEKKVRLPASEKVPSTTLPSVSLPDTIENITIPSAENDTDLLQPEPLESTTPRPIPAKTRHLYLEITAVVDSLISHDLRAILNKTELETIEILKLYYIHIFMGVEQVYRQSLIHETLDVHIRLSKIIFATDKHRLPWETFKNISTLANTYRKSPNDMQLRPNMSMSLLKSLHQAYTSANFEKRYFSNGADHIMTFTRLDLIDGAGSAYVLGTCLPLYKYSIVQEDLNAFSVMITVTHELGHNLGLDHDETENTCNDPSFRYIMSPKNMNTATRRQLSSFSECSIKQLNHFADNTTTTCWKNKIVSTRNDTKLEKIRNVISMKLGQMVNLHQQCQLQYGPKAIPFVSVTYDSKNHSMYEENICNQLRCFKTPEDSYMFWQDGAFDGTVCGENQVCHKKQCIATNETGKESTVVDCPYGDLFVPIPMLNLPGPMSMGNMPCPAALNLLRSHGVNVTHLCYNSTLPFRRLCCEECKKHSIPECGDLHTKCPNLGQYCKMQFMTMNGVPIKEMCPYTCGECPNLPPPPPPPSTTTMATLMEEEVSTQTTKKPTTKKVKPTKPTPRKYVKPKKFDKYTCIDAADCSSLVKVYSKLKKNVKNWCTEYSTMVRDRYFAEVCPRYCSLCKMTSECDEYKLCRNNGTCIKDEHGTYQCLCSTSKSYYGTLCEYRRTCSDNPCASKTEYCIQTQGEGYVCLSKDDKEKMRDILDGKK